MTIFVSIASYRDEQLVPTIRDCLAAADRPNDLRIVVNWQHAADDEDIRPQLDDPRVEVLDFDVADSRGVCWARRQVQRQYAGEDWYLQIDSHIRFAAGWDTRLIAMAAHTGSPRPILSCYPPSYDPNTEFTGSGEPTGIYVGGWNDAGLPIFHQMIIPGWQQLTAPVRARLTAAGFLFAPGSLALDVPYDENIYYQGEEITLSVRAFTSGYDLFHPVEVVAWHYYIREGAPRHWMDHGTGEGFWYQLDRTGRRRSRTMLRYGMIGGLGLGTVRTLADYQQYAGIDFAAQTATPEAMSATEPAEFTLAMV